MRAALLETSIEPAASERRRRHRHRRSRAPGEVLVRVTHCGVCHSDLSLVERHVPDFGADRARPRGRGRRRRGRRGRHRARARRQGRAHADRRVRRVLLVPARRVRLLRQRDGASPPARCSTATRRCRATVRRCCAASVSVASRRYVITPESRRGQGRRRHAARDRVRHRLRGADRRRRGAQHRARRPEGATVLVVGAGGIGIAIVQGARIAGAARIIVSDPVAERRDAARALRRDRRDRPDCATTSSAPCTQLTGRHRCRLRVRRGRRRARSSRRASGRRATAARR